MNDKIVVIASESLANSNVVQELKEYALVPNLQYLDLNDTNQVMEVLKMPKRY